MFADLAPAFSGPFDRFSKSVVGPEDPRPALSIRALTSDPEALVEKMLRRLAPEASTPQSRRGAASLQSTASMLRSLLQAGEAMCCAAALLQ